jgi:ribosomal protein S18 acetylase RimI-like enzyme
LDGLHPDVLSPPAATTSPRADFERFFASTIVACEVPRAMEGHADVVSLSARRARPESLSKRWLGLDWGEHLPWELCGLSVELADMAEVMPFVEERYPELFGLRPDDDRFLPDPMRLAKWRFFEESDVFVFRDGGDIVGLQIAHPTDWSSYYIRSLALLPAYRNRGLIAELTREMCAVLATFGVERVEGETAPPNVPCLISQSRLGYMPTGTLNSDRWGAMIRMTKYLREDAADVFRDQFCYGTWPRCRDG